MRPLDRKLLRDLAAARASLAAILLVIALGIAAFGGMRASYHNLDEARADYEARCRMPHLWLPLERMPLPELDRVERVPGVAEARGRTSFAAILDLPEAPRPISGLVLSLPDDPRRAEGAIGGALLQRGSWFSGPYAEEVLVNADFARERGLEPGDELRVILNDRRQSLRIAGIAQSSEHLYVMPPGGMAPEPADYAILWIPELWAQATLDLDGACNEVVVRLERSIAESGAAVRDVVGRLEARLESFGLAKAVTRSEQASARFIRDEIDGLRVNSLVLPAIFLAVAAMVMNVMLGRLVEQQRSVIGTLKALGHANAALVRHYAAFGLLVGLAGGIAGTVLGHLLADGMTAMYRGFYSFPRLENPFRPTIALAGTLAAAAFGALGALGGVRRVVRLQPAEAMRPSPPPSVRRTLLERIAGLGPAGRAVIGLLGIRWRLALRSLLRQRRRTAVGVVSCALGTGLIFTSLSMFPAMRVLIDQQFVRTIRSDRDLVLRDERPGRAVREAAILPGVDRVEGQFTVAGTFANAEGRGQLRQDGAITGLERGAALTRLFDRDGTPVPVPERGVVLTRRLADRLGVGLGGRIRFAPVRGERSVRAMTVTGIADTYLGLGAWADAGWLRNLMGEEDTVTVLQLAVRRDPAVRARLDRALKEIPAISAVNDHERTRRRLEETFLGTMKTSVGTLVVFAGGIVFGAILTTQLVSVSERRREIATLVVNGESPARVAGLFLRESVVVNGLGALLGLPVGTALLAGLNSAFQTELFGFPLVLAPSVYAWSVALSTGFAVVAWLPVRRAVARMDWRSALNASE